MDFSIALTGLYEASDGCPFGCPFGLYPTVFFITGLGTHPIEQLVNTVDVNSKM